MKRSPLARRTPLRSSPDRSLSREVGLKRRKPAKRSKGVSPASRVQRAWVRGRQCIVTGRDQVDPAHLCPRDLGGCDEPRCVVPLTREIHDLFDDGRFDLLPYLVRDHRQELAHMQLHMDPIAMVERLTGCKVTLVDRQASR